MRRGLGAALMATLVGCALLGTAGAATASPATSAGAPTAPSRPAPGPREGFVLNGLHQGSPTGRCHGTFELADGCTHGPDPAPPGIDVRVRMGVPVLAGDSASSGTTAAATAGIQCYGDGVSGNRVQAIYAHAADVTDRYSSEVGNIRQWAGAVDAVFNQSAGETGGVRHVRYVTDSSCNLSVLDVQLSTTGDDTINNTISELRSQGFTRSDRKYLIWMDANVYCGIAQVYSDDSAGANNLANGNSSIQGEVARVDNSCWGLSGQSIEAHELMHTLGGVQTSAPHATKYDHCWDQADRMCYDDGSGSAMQQICNSSEGNSFDCNHDDYFYAGTPPAANYLATHWNTANSSFLATTAGTATGSTTTTTPPTTTPPTTSPPTTSPPTTMPPPSTGPAWQAWSSLGAPAGGLASGPAVASWAAGRFDVFAKGADSALWHAWFDGAWHGWESLGGGLAGDPGVTSWGSGRLDVVVRGTDNNLWHKWFDGAWRGWENLGAPAGGLTSGPDLAAWSAGRLDIFARGTDNALWHMWFDGAWRGWESLGGGLASDPGASAGGSGHLDVVVQGTDSNLWHKLFDGTWHAWESLGAPSGGLTSGPGIASWAPGRLDIFVRGTDNGLWRKWFDGSWHGWESLGGGLAGNPAAAAPASGRLGAFVTGTDRNAWFRLYG